MIVCPWKDISRYYGCLPGLKEAVELVNTLENPAVGNYPLPTGRYMVQHITTKPEEGALFEAHRRFADVQYIVSGGGEDMKWAPLDTLTTVKPYDEGKDVEKLSGEGITIHIPDGYVYIAFPEDGHMPGLGLDGAREVDKIVIKLPG
ncbi:MAG: YhcH/YjgK/YiaL family protein [Clostridiales bacterium]|nr:YhcH/YjgK/YiaL family protein [Clostridiales bacterium]